MTDAIHKFKVGQTVGLIPSTLRAAAKGAYQILGLRLTDGGTMQYRIKSEEEAYERVVAESDLVLALAPNFEAD